MWPLSNYSINFKHWHMVCIRHGKGTWTHGYLPEPIPFWFWWEKLVVPANEKWDMFMIRFNPSNLCGVYLRSFSIHFIAMWEGWSVWSLVLQNRSTSTQSTSYASRHQLRAMLAVCGRRCAQPVMCVLGGPPVVLFNTAWVSFHRAKP